MTKRRQVQTSKSQEHQSAIVLHASANPLVNVGKPDEAIKNASDKPNTLTSIGVVVAFLAPIFLGVGYFFSYGILSHFGISRDSFVRSNEIYVFRTFDAAYTALKVLFETDTAFWLAVGMAVLPALLGFGLLAALFAYTLRLKKVDLWRNKLRTKALQDKLRLPKQIALFMASTLIVPFAIVYFLILLVFAYLIPGMLGDYSAKTEAAAFLQAGGCDPKDLSKLHLHPCTEVINEKTGAIIGRGLQVAISEKSIALFDPVRSTTVLLTLSDNVRVERRLFASVPANKNNQPNPPTK